MVNPWYTRVFSALAGMKVKSKQHRDEFALVEAGFDSVKTYIDAIAARALKLPAAPAPSDQLINFTAAQRVGKVVSFDAAGNVTLAAAPPSAPGGTASSTVDLLTGADIASAATVNLDAATGNRVHITGTTAITAVTLSKGPRTVVFDDALTLTHHATNLNLPGAANITTAAGDRAIFESDGTTVYCVAYQKASGRAAVEALAASQAQMEAGASNSVMATPGTVNWHPGVAKAWIKCNAAGAIEASHNITSITDDGVGTVTVTIGVDFSSANYTIVATALSASRYAVRVASQAAGSFQLVAFDTNTGSAFDPTSFFAACFGDQA